MLNYDDIKVEFESQGFRCSHIGFSPKKDKSVIFMESTASTESIHCPYCQKNVRMIENVHITLKDMMIWHGIEQNTFINLHRYQCNGCMKTFTEMLKEQVSFIIDSKPCKTLVIDTIEWAGRLCITYICSIAHKEGIEEFGYYALCDLKITRVYTSGTNTFWWESTAKVCLANGKESKVCGYVMQWVLMKAKRKQ